MNIRLMWGLYDLYRKIGKVPKEGIMNMGWKTITGAILVGLGYASKMLISVVPELDQVGDGLIALGAIIGGVGVAHKIEKVRADLGTKG